MNAHQHMKIVNIKVLMYFRPFFEYEYWSPYFKSVLKSYLKLWSSLATGRRQLWVRVWRVWSMSMSTQKMNSITSSLWFFIWAQRIIKDFLDTRPQETKTVWGECEQKFARIFFSLAQIVSI